jgi:CRP/FNR family cyclic AMP-dependent transcriptional regulator
MPVDASVLAEIAHLRELNENERAALAERIELLSYAAGETICKFGDPGHAMYIVRSGEIEIFVTNDQGEKIVLEVSNSGDVFGEVSLLDNGPRTASVAAVTSAEVLRLDREHFEDYVRVYTPAALNLLSVIARRLRKSDEMIRRTVSRNANDVAQEQETLLTTIADAVPKVFGTLPSVLLHGLFLTVWVLINVGLIAGIRIFDVFPFYILSMVVGLESILLTLFVLTSQNRQQARERIRSDIEFESSVNSELKIAYLHEKIDRLTEGHYELMTNTRKILAGMPGADR